LSKYVVDAWTWVEYLIGSEFGIKLREVLDEDSSEVYTCAVTVAEVVSKVAREGRDVEAAYALLLSNSQVVNANEELSKHAGLLHCEMRKGLKDFGLADAYVLATARKLKAKVLTGDVHFKGVKEAVLIR
jgi:predicted nucleic acid-binding protein